MRYDIINGTNNGRAKILSPCRTVNLYPEMEDGETSNNIKALIGCPGYTRVAQESEATNNIPCRGMYTTSTGRMFSIIYNTLYELSTLEGLTDRGTIYLPPSPISPTCRMSDNGVQMLITNGYGGYIYNLSTDSLSSISDSDFPGVPNGPTSNIFTDGYFLVNSSGTGKFYFSNSYDGTSWDSLDFATAEYSGDTLVGIAKTSNGVIWMIGEQTTELWNNVGTANLPWRRIAGSTKIIGCCATDSISSNGDNVFWLGDGNNGYGAVFMGAGYEVIRISTPAIEYQIKQQSDIIHAIGFTYSEEGHKFYILSFDNLTLAYDVITGRWHERTSYSTTTGKEIRLFAQWSTFFNGKNYVGSYEDDGIYEMSLDIYTDRAEPVIRKVITPNISNENKILRHKWLELSMEKGIGLSGESDPIVMMKYSNDGGHIYSNIDATVSPGGIGEYETRVRWPMLGMSRNRTYELSMSDAVKCVINGAFLEVG